MQFFFQMPVFFSDFAFKRTHFAQALDNFAQKCVCTSETFISSEYLKVQEFIFRKVHPITVYYLTEHYINITKSTTKYK